MFPMSRSVRYIHRKSLTFASPFLPKRHVGNALVRRAWRLVGWVLRPPLHVGLLEVRNDSELHGALVGEETERLVVVHGADVRRIEQVVVLDVKALLGVHDLAPSYPQHLGQHVRRLHVQARKKQPRCHTAVHDGVRVKLPISGFKLAEALQDDGYRNSPCPRRRDDARKLGNGEVAEFVQEEIYRQALGCECGILEAVMG